MRLQLIVPDDKGASLIGKLKEWDALVEQSDKSNGMLKVVRFFTFWSSIDTVQQIFILAIGIIYI